MPGLPFANDPIRALIRHEAFAQLGIPAAGGVTAFSILII